MTDVTRPITSWASLASLRRRSTTRAYAAVPLSCGSRGERSGVPLLLPAGPPDGAVFIRSEIKIRTHSLGWRYSPKKNPVFSNKWSGLGDPIGICFRPNQPSRRTLVFASGTLSYRATRTTFANSGPSATFSSRPLLRDGLLLHDLFGAASLAFAARSCLRARSRRVRAGQRRRSWHASTTATLECQFIGFLHSSASRMQAAPVSWSQPRSSYAGAAYINLGCCTIGSLHNNVVRR